MSIVKNPKLQEYRRSKKGCLLRRYEFMDNRVSGKTNYGVENQIKLYGGLPILSKEEFMEWAWNEGEFHKLHKEWVDSGYQRKYSPTVNRMIPKKGYIPGNINWKTQSKNASEAKKGKGFGKTRYYKLFNPTRAVKGQKALGFELGYSFRGGINWKMINGRAIEITKEEYEKLCV